MELEKKRQGYNSDQIILGLHLPGRKMIMGDCMSSISSGFVSHDHSNTGKVVNKYFRYISHHYSCSFSY